MLKLDPGPVQAQGLAQTASLPTLFQLEREGFTPRGFGVPLNPPTFTSELPWFHPGRMAGAEIWGTEQDLPAARTHRGHGGSFAGKWFEFLKRRSLNRRMRWSSPGHPGCAGALINPQQILLSHPVVTTNPLNTETELAQDHPGKL